MQLVITPVDDVRCLHDESLDLTSLGSVHVQRGSHVEPDLAGLSFEGVFRQAAVYKGRNRDTAWYAAIDQEWPALQSAFSRWLDPANFDEHGKQRVALSTLTAPILKLRG